MPTPETAQRHCDGVDCPRVDVQPGVYHPSGFCRSAPAAFCPRHLPSRADFTPTPPDAESLSGVSDEALLADLFARALHLQLLALDTRANAIGDLHIRPNVCGATIDLTFEEMAAIRRRFRS